MRGGAGRSPQIAEATPDNQPGQDGQAEVPPEATNELGQLLRLIRIHPGRRLIEQEQDGIRGERPGGNEEGRLAPAGPRSKLSPDRGKDDGIDVRVGKSVADDGLRETHEFRMLLRIRMHCRNRKKAVCR